MIFRVGDRGRSKTFCGAPVIDPDGNDVAAVCPGAG
jgi:hypothetical protein